MEMENKPMEQPMQPQAAVAKAIGPEQLQKFMQMLFVTLEVRHMKKAKIVIAFGKIV